MESLALLTDLYQLTMANGYFKLGIHNKQACFHQFFRRNPFKSAFAIAAGFDTILDFLDNFRFTPDDLEYLSSLQIFDSHFLKYLSELRLNVEISAVAEGHVVFAHEPLLRVRGPLLQCQLVETALLNGLNFQTLIATKAARCVIAAQGREVIEFGLRRAQGPNGGLSATRAAFVGGCQSTSNVLAGKRFDIPVKGTQAHSWIMAFGDELRAFRAYAEAMPENVVLLVDTYHTLSGIRNAITVGLELKQRGQVLRGIRLDSGDFLSLSKTARTMLDEAGLHEVKILVSGDLDEYKIEAMMKENAPIDAFGVGTRLSTAFEEPALGGVYKLSAIENDAGVLTGCLKISDDHEKTTLPGLLQVRRFLSEKYERDVIYSEEDAAHLRGGEDLLTPVWRNGHRLGVQETLKQAQQRALKDLSLLDESHLLLKDAAAYDVSVEKHLRLRQISLAPVGFAQGGTA